MVASDVGVGDVLSQRKGDGEQVVAYYSWTMNQAEWSYCITRRELLAVIQALRHFRPYLHRSRFLLRTDHASLMAQSSLGVRQKRAYDTHCRGQAFAAEDKVWVFCPTRTKGVSPKLRSEITEVGAGHGGCVPGAHAWTGPDGPCTGTGLHHTAPLPHLLWRMWAGACPRPA